MPRSFSRSLLSAFVPTACAWALSACPVAGDACLADENCPFDQVCVDAICEWPMPGQGLGGPGDKPPVRRDDAGVVLADAGFDGTEDAGRPADAGPGAPDAHVATADAGAHTLDAAEPEADDAGAPDAAGNGLDAGAPDAVVVEPEPEPEPDPVPVCGDVWEPPPANCPAACTGGCADGVCHVDCSGTGLLFGCVNADITCPEGMPCDVQCTGWGACKNVHVDCADSAPCSITCAGQSSQCDDARFHCGDNQCHIQAEPTLFGQEVDCNDSCDCQYEEL